ncbi:hypothetical protein Poli38472_005169 [Pythium oligandrum]|uniref:Homoserine dehydrogenase n=1 Tax=Pythium oligandrum TaxID=41045 RepID=A0A8K1FHB9_PYTOL|nr:hypothetical protein Poli38472_005169 [Pythium oligandrum]|eukprot:TMW62551.1 hypothetical protein Poli38472_005169 [Pythium oligandrum]
MDCTSPSTLIGSKWAGSIPQLSLDAVSAKVTHLDHRTGARNIYKFGGTSVGSPSRLCGLIHIIREERARVHAIVVSAMGDTTDFLLDAVDAAARGDDKSAMQVVDDLVELSIRNAHETQRLVYAEQGIPDKSVEDMTTLVLEFFKPLRELLFGICLLQEKTSAALDTVLSFGERMSAQIVARLLTNAGVEAVYLDAREWLTTDDTFGCAKVFFEESKQKLQQLSTQWNGRLPIITGFIGKARNGRTTTLGRNGSDYTATIVGACLNADYVLINTDISGVMTADPRIVDRAVALSHLNHHEALELAVYGTRMFHARTMVPLIHGGVTMLIRNTMDPNGQGTYISSVNNTGKPETCTTSLENLAILEVRTRILQDGSQNTQENIGARITKLLEAQKIPVWLSIRGAHGQAISVVIPIAMLDAACVAINAELQTELENEEVDPINALSPVTMLSIVAEDFSKIPYDQTKFFAALADANIEVLAVGQGTSSRSLSCVIHGKDTKVAVRRVHDAFNVDYIETNIVLLGCNHISLEVLRQLEQQVELYRRQHKVVVKIVGFGSNCCEFTFKPKGFEWSELVQRLQSCKSTDSVFTEQKSVSSSDERYFGAPSNEMLDALQDLSNPILMDCSGNAATHELYLRCIDRGVHAVVSNARSMSTVPTTQSRESVATSGRKGRSFFMYTSTIGASLPVIDTLGNILRTGDRVQTISAALSGSMGFVTNEVMQGKSLSEAVRTAILKGYCERDPREDFTGRDMAAKIIVMARALGARLDLNAIEIEPLIPGSVLSSIPWAPDMTLDAIIDGIAQYDTKFREKYYTPAVASSQRLRFVASIDLTAFPSIKAKIHPALVSEDHPAFFAQDDEIAVGFSTLQYQPRPLVLKGSGTGATASATGVLRDVLTIVRSLHGKPSF